MAVDGTADQSAAATRADVIIAGANYTGLAAALCLTETLGDEPDIVVLDRRSVPAREVDARCFAVSAGSRNLLARLDVWPDVARHAQDVVEIAISDTSLEAAVRPMLLRYDNRLDDGTPAASIVPATALSDALRAAVRRRPNVRVLHEVALSALQTTSGSIALSDESGRAWSASLLIGADGRGSRVRELAGIKTNLLRHAQTGIVTVIRHTEPHHGCAIQHFLPGGPFAILPLTGNRSCITWSEQDREAKRILALDDAGFLAEIDRRVAGHLGTLELEGQRSSFPLSTQIARGFTAPRVALVGDAAHGVHPIAGQGLNLAFRDVAALAQRIREATHVGLDLGDLTALEAYQSWRRFDSTLSAGVFDALNRVFSSDIALFRSAREAGLELVDRLPSVKRQLVLEAAGLSGDVPELMRG